MFVIIWQYQVKAGAEAEFERVYGADGEWVRLFAQSSGFLRSALLRDSNSDGQYMTLDHWGSREAFEQFAVKFRQEYEAMDLRCGALTYSESFIGQFDGLDSK